MGVTYNKGRRLSRNENAFDESSVEIADPFKQLDNQTFKSIQTFHTKKMAAEFCEKWSIKPARIIKVESRFQFGWAVDLGRDSFMPEYADGHLGMACFGFKLGRVDDNRMWL